MSLIVDIENKGENLRYDKLLNKEIMEAATGIEPVFTALQAAA